MSEYDGLNVGFGGERIALPAGKYGDSVNSELKIVNYNGVLPSRADADLQRHGFLVAHTNGVEGTAFLTLQLKRAWLTPEAISLVFNKGVPVGRATQAGIDTFRESLQEYSVGRATANNTPDDQLEEQAGKIYGNTIKQIQIAVGSLFRLQDWRGEERNPDIEPAALLGTEFSGTVGPGYKEGTSEVSNVYTRKRART